MKRARQRRRAGVGRVRALGILAVVVFLAPWGAADESGTRPGLSVQLEGEYVWNHEDYVGPLSATLEPTDDGYAVALTFEFRTKTYTYSGHAHGDLTGELKGQVQPPKRGRTFEFVGRFEDGVFRGRHAEITDGSRYETGTMTLTRDTTATPAG